MQTIAGCTSLKTFTIGKSLKILGCSNAMFGTENYPTSLNYFFYYCDSLETIIVDEENEYYSSKDGVLYHGKLEYSYENQKYIMEGKRETLAYYPPKKATEDFVIPDFVEKIDGFAFANNYLKTVTISEKIFNFDSSTFSKCPNLEAYYVDSNNLAFVAIDGVLFYRYVEFNSEGICEYLGNFDSLFAYPANKPDTSYTISNDISCIYEKAFYDNKNLESVTISTGSNYWLDISSSAFENCSNLSTINLPYYVSIYQRAFYGTSLSNCSYDGTMQEFESHCYDGVSSAFEYGTTIRCIDGDYCVVAEE